jgi:hypothetical protein
LNSTGFDSVQVPELERSASVQLDPVVVETLIAIVEEDRPQAMPLRAVSGL